MTLALGLIVLAAIGAVLGIYGHGYPNVVDTFALALHRHAKTVRRMQEDRTAKVAELWVKELEG